MEKKEKERAISLINTLRNETQPMDYHPDPEVIDDYWRILIEIIEEKKSDPEQNNFENNEESIKLVKISNWHEVKSNPYRSCVICKKEGVIIKPLVLENDPLSLEETIGEGVFAQSCSFCEAYSIIQKEKENRYSYQTKAEFEKTFQEIYDRRKRGNR